MSPTTPRDMPAEDLVDYLFPDRPASPADLISAVYKIKELLRYLAHNIDDTDLTAVHVQDHLLGLRDGLPALSTLLNGLARQASTAGTPATGINAITITSDHAAQLQQAISRAADLSGRH